MIPYDKRIHFSVCFLITFLLFPLIGWFGAGTAIATGFLKEIYDWRDYGGFSWSDIAADIAGTITAISVIILISIS